MSDELVERLRRDKVLGKDGNFYKALRNPDGPAAADEIERLRSALQLIRDTFERDEAQGYHSSTRTFALDIARNALKGNRADPTDPSS